MPKLLIVDDEDDVREFAANFFRKRKIEVFTAANGEEAVEKVKSQEPNLILLDILMSGINGIQTLETIRTFNKTVKVIMVTGAKPEENETFKRCRELGAYDYIHKPLKLEELEQTVMKALKEVA
jgi:DNA-binding response OmpR family regulator